LRRAKKELEEELFFKEPDFQQILQEKQNLQLTLRSLTEEVELLSKKNESFLRELKQKDFYDTYRKQGEELQKLREAHSQLINLIQTQDPCGRNSLMDGKKSLSSIGSLISNAGRDSIIGKHSLPLRRLLSCGSKSTSGASEGFGMHVAENHSDSFETLESVQVIDVDSYIEAILGKQQRFTS